MINPLMTPKLQNDVCWTMSAVLQGSILPPRHKSLLLRQKQVHKEAAAPLSLLVALNHSSNWFNDSRSLSVNKGLLRLRPSCRNGIDTAAPSGKFWIPIPSATETAANIAAVGLSAVAAAPNATPRLNLQECYAM